MKVTYSGNPVNFRNFGNALGSISMLTGKLQFMFNDKPHVNLPDTKYTKVIHHAMWRGIEDEEYTVTDSVTFPNITNKELAKKLATGWVDPRGWVVPPRPMLSQFWAENGSYLKDTIGKLVNEQVKKELDVAFFKGIEPSESQMDKDINTLMDNIGTVVTEEFRQFIFNGKVMPGNADIVIRRKGFDKPGYWTGDLVDNLEWKWIPAQVPTGMSNGRY